MIRIACCSSQVEPKVIVPKQISETIRPLRPIRRFFMIVFSFYSQYLVRPSPSFAEQLR
jgi:hypothetical protein